MNSFFALCFLATCCMAQVMAYNNPLDQLRQTLERSKSEVKTIMSDTKRTRNNLSMSSENKLSNINYQQWSTVNSYVDRSLSQIRADVDAAKTEGKSVEQCYTTAKDSLNSYRRVMVLEMQTCQENGRRSLVNFLTPLDTVEQTGNQYITQLDNVFLKCYTSNIIQMQSCIAINLGTINNSIRAFKSTVSQLIQSANRNTNSVIVSANTCSMNASSKIYSNTATVKIAASQCIKN